MLRQEQGTRQDDGSPRRDAGHRHFRMQSSGLPVLTYACPGVWAPAEATAPARRAGRPGRGSTGGPHPRQSSKPSALLPKPAHLDAFLSTTSQLLHLLFLPR